MNFATILSAINKAVELIPTAVSLGGNVMDLVERVKKITSKDPDAITQQDLDDLQAENDALKAEIETLEKRA